MKKTYFLDKIHNANFREFDNIMKAIIEDLKQTEFPYSYLKKGNSWLLEIEKEDDLVSVLFDDYSMIIYSSLKDKSANYSHFWQQIFNKFLNKNQKYYYKKDLEKLEKKNKNINEEEIVEIAKF